MDNAPIALMRLTHPDVCDDDTNTRAFTGSRSVPRVFIGHKFFGDSSATTAASKSGELERALRGAGVHVN